MIYLFLNPYFESYRNNQQSLVNVFGSMYGAVMFLGMTSGSSVQPIVAGERVVMYRERFAGMYSSYAYSLAQVHLFSFFMKTES